MENKIQELTTSGISTDIESTGIVSTSGLLISGNFSDGIKNDTVAAMSHALYANGIKSADAFGIGTVQQVMIKHNNGEVLVQLVDDESRSAEDQMPVSCLHVSIKRDS